MNKTSLLPQTDRIIALDILRGIAVLGILIVNIQNFAMISAAYINPTAYGDLNGANRTVWLFTHIMADQKFITIFSMLFGAGIVLFAGKVEEKGYRPARFYYRRLFWLFTIGLLHAYLLWYGDILVAYAICGAVAFLFRRISPWVLIAIGIMVFLVPTFNYWLFGKSMAMWPPEALEGIIASWTPGSQAVETEILAHRGSFIEQLNWRIPEAFKMQTFIFLILLGWRVLAMMLIGMGLFKLGFLTASLDVKTYLILAVLTFITGFSLVIYGVNANFDAGWSVEYSMFFGSQWNYIGSFFVALGYISVIMVLVNKVSMGLFSKLGKMAFTNYLLTSVICGFIFYGHGFGKFGSVERVQQAIYVIWVWLVLMALSWIWLRYFYFGPVEWLWRYLTYGNKPAMKRHRG